MSVEQPVSNQSTVTADGKVYVLIEECVFHIDDMERYTITVKNEGGIIHELIIMADVIELVEL